MKAITFTDLSDDNKDTLRVTDQETGVERTGPSLVFRAATPHTLGISVVLNYQQVFKLRAKLSEFLAEKLGTGAAPWVEDE